MSCCRITDLAWLTAVMFLAIGKQAGAADYYVDAGTVGLAFSLANTTTIPLSRVCPLPKADCSRLRLLDGSMVDWPIELAPGEAVVLTAAKQS